MYRKRRTEEVSRKSCLYVWNIEIFDELLLIFLKYYPFLLKPIVSIFFFQVSLFFSISPAYCRSKHPTVNFIVILFQIIGKGFRHGWNVHLLYVFAPPSVLSERGNINETKWLLCETRALSALIKTEKKSILAWRKGDN